MKKEIIYILKRVIIGVLIAIVLFSIKSCQVKAAVVVVSDNVVLSGDSLKDIAKIGTYKVGKGYYTEYTDNVYIEKYFSFDFVTNLVGGLDEVNGGDNYTTRYSLDICVNGGTPNIALWSSYNNFIDLVVPTGTTVYATNESWANLQCYRAYIRLNTSYLPISIPDYTFKYMEVYSNNVIKIGVSANYGYGLMVRFNDMVYYTAGDYDRVLNEAKEQNRQYLIEQGITSINNSLTDETPPNLSALNNSAGWMPAGPVDSILNLPLALLNNINTNLSKTCQPVILNIPYINEELPIPCITTLYNQIGIMPWVNGIGAVASAFILLSYFIRLYKWVEDTLTFRENTQQDSGMWGGA